jgi:hypothetical protein
MSADTHSTMLNLWLDDQRDPRIWARPEGLEWCWVETIEQAKQVLKTERVAIASLDNDLGLGMDYEGTDLVRWMAEFDIWPTEACYVHTSNPAAHKYMTGVIERYGPYS